MEIKLTPEELAAVNEAAQDMATTKGISADQAVKDMLAMGMNNWYAMQDMARRQAKSKAENFNPFAVARGEAEWKR